MPNGNELWETLEGLAGDGSWQEYYTLLGVVMEEEAQEIGELSYDYSEGDGCGE